MRANSEQKFSDGVISQQGERWLYPLIFALLFTAALGFFRHTVTGWEPQVHEDGSADYGLLHYFYDNFNYVSWAQQAKRGNLVFENLYTLTAHEKIFFNPMMLATGWIACWADIHVLRAINIVSLVGVFFGAFCIASIAFGFCRTRSAALVAIAVVYGGGGTAWFSTTGFKLSGYTYHVSPEMYYLDLFPLTQSYMYPFHSLAFSIEAVFLWCFWQITKRHPRSLAPYFGLALFCIFWTLTRPYEAIMPMGAIVMMLFWLVQNPLGRRYPRIAKRYSRMVIVMLGVALALIYFVWLGRHEIWSFMGRAQMQPWAGDTNWAAALFLAIVLGVMSWKWSSRNPLFQVFCQFWSLQVLVLLFVFQGASDKLCGGMTLPLGLLAGLGFERLSSHVPSIRWQRFATLALIVAAVASGVSMIRLRSIQYENISRDLPPELIQISEYLMDAEDLPTVLTSAENGRYLPGLAGVRVHAGHPFLTDDLEKKAAELQAFFGLVLSADESHGAEIKLLLDEGVFTHLIATQYDLQNQPHLESYREVKPVYSAGDLRLIDLR